MDEPFGALDPITRETSQDELKRLQAKLKKTIIFVTHDMDEALKLADRIVQRLAILSASARLSPPLQECHGDDSLVSFRAYLFYVNCTDYSRPCASR